MLPRLALPVFLRCMRPPADPPAPCPTHLTPQGPPVLPRGRLVLPQLQHPQLRLARPVLQVPGAPRRLKVMRRSAAQPPGLHPAAVLQHAGRPQGSACSDFLKQPQLPDQAAGHMPAANCRLPFRGTLHFPFLLPTALRAALDAFLLLLFPLLVVAPSDARRSPLW